MKRGYITLAQNNNDTDYIRQAYALALSIKNTQSTVNEFAICVEDKTKVPKKYLKVFDHVIEIPGGDEAKDEDWKIHNKWKYFEMSPFDETVILDADMIFTDDVSHWWDFLTTRNVHFTSTVHNYKGQVATSDYYRKTFTRNELPNVYTAFFYFNKSKEAEELFKLAEIIYQNWEEVYFEFLPLQRPKQVSGDIVFALATKILGLNSTDDMLFPSFVHMKSKMMDIPDTHIIEEWTTSLPTYFTDKGILKVSNYKQSLPFHYHIKSWLTPKVVKQLEEIYDGQK